MMARGIKTIVALITFLAASCYGGVWPNPFTTNRDPVSVVGVITNNWRGPAVVVNTDVTVAGDLRASVTPRLPCQIVNFPIPDGNPNILHPSVLYLRTNWNGYRWWAAATPYPDESREKPCIYVSTNGIDWFPPPGLVNPITTNVFSDPALFLRRDGTMFLFCHELSYQVYGNVRWFTSTNGTNWSGPFGNGVGGTARELVSPSVVTAPNNTNVFMYLFDSSKPNLMVSDWTATNWSAPVELTNVPFAWHGTVFRTRSGGYRYYGAGGPAGATASIIISRWDSINGTNWVKYGDFVICTNLAPYTWYYTACGLDGPEELIFVSLATNNVSYAFRIFSGPVNLALCEVKRTLYGPELISPTLSAASGAFDTVTLTNVYVRSNVCLIVGKSTFYIRPVLQGAYVQVRGGPFDVDNPAWITTVTGTVMRTYFEFTNAYGAALVYPQLDSILTNAYVYAPGKTNWMIQALGGGLYAIATNPVSGGWIMKQLAP